MMVPLALFVTSAASAQPRAGDSRAAETMQYGAPAGCPGRSSFLERSGDSLARLRDGERINVNVSAGEHGYSGEIELLGADSTIWNRDIGGRSCDEVVSALALSLSVFVDGLARDVVHEPVTSAAPTTAPASSADRASEPAPIAAPRALRWRFAVDAGAGLRSGLGETLDPSLRLGLEASGYRPVGHDYRLGFELGRGTVRTLPSTLADRRWDHAWWTASAQGCPWGLALTASLGVEPCVAVHGGRYAARVSAGPERASWLGLVELTLRTRWRWGRLAGSLDLGGFVPLSPLGIEREGQVFFRQRAGTMAALGLAYDLLELENE
ncbi:MAG: hypothetical protein ABW217_19095 [Polyangiaceae bacterium]